MSQAALRLPLAPSAASKGDSVSDALRGATSHEIVFAVVGHAGAGTSWVAKVIADGLGSFNYTPLVIKMSDLIAATVEKLDRSHWETIRAATAGSIERTSALQAAGNWLRAQHGITFTAALAIRRLFEERTREKKEGARTAYILDSLKNPYEVDALRKLYGRSLYVVSVVCGPELRESRLIAKYKGASKKQIQELMERDEAEAADAGQHVRKTLKAGDFFVNNEETITAAEARPLDHSVRRFLQIVFSSDVVRPTADERGMYAAWGASLRSSCLSRQVGAAILDSHGELIATGTNDVPRFGGGLYEEPDGIEGPDDGVQGRHDAAHRVAQDARCFHYFDEKKGETKGFCRNDRVKDEILKRAVEELRTAGVLRDGAAAETIVSALRKTPLSDLLEFSRAVHAEMDALVSLARAGGPATRGGTLYCTTYPCHPCARHIVAAGIKDVIYIEPYSKSRAATLHDDAIVESTKRPDEGATRVHFRLFTGVAPWRYAALFEKRGELKKDGDVCLPEEQDALHVDPIFTKSYRDFEQLIAKQVDIVTGATTHPPAPENVSA